MRRRSISESSSARSPSVWRASVLYAASVSPYFGSRRKRRRAKRSSGEFWMGVPVRHLVEIRGDVGEMWGRCEGDVREM